MKALLSMVTSLALTVALIAGLQAADEKKAEKGKEVTLKGTLVCGKCTLKETEKCTNVLQVKEGDKTVNYYIEDEGNKAAYHKGICPAGKTADATVTGTVTEKDGKKMVKGKVEVK
jgi:hypothetical protein